VFIFLVLGLEELHRWKMEKVLQDECVIVDDWETNKPKVCIKTVRKIVQLPQNTIGEVCVNTLYEHEFFSLKH